MEDFAWIILVALTVVLILLMKKVNTIGQSLEEIKEQIAKLGTPEATGD